MVLLYTFIFFLEKQTFSSIALCKSMRLFEIFLSKYETQTAKNCLRTIFAVQIGQETVSTLVSVKLQCFAVVAQRIAKQTFRIGGI